MTDKHTPEPWHVGVDKGYGGCPDITVCSSSGPVISSSADICGSSYVEITEEDARRIIACVNACKGIPTEWLESETLDKGAAYRIAFEKGRREGFRSAEKKIADEYETAHRSGYNRGRTDAALEALDAKPVDNADGAVNVALSCARCGCPKAAHEHSDDAQCWACEICDRYVPPNESC